MKRPTIYLALSLTLGTLPLVCGCAGQGEVRLWPIVDIEHPGPGDGSHVEVLWPIIEVDNTRPKTAFAVRPLFSYDANRARGSYLWPFGSFGAKPDPFFHFWPIYQWTQWNEVTESGQHTLFPFGGYWHEEGNRHWLWGPALFYRERDDDGKHRIDASILGPVVYDRDEESSFLLIGPYYRHVTPGSRSHVLFPLLWWRDLGAPEERHVRTREFFPVVGWNRVQDGDEVLSTRLRVAWPLLNLEWGPEARWNQILLYLISWRSSEGQLQSLNILPFFSYGPNHFSLPWLGYCGWDSTEGGKEGGKRGWAAWPFVTHQLAYGASENGPPELSRDLWTYAAGLAGHDERPRSRGHWVWPFYETRTGFGPEGDVTSTDRRYLAGLVRHRTLPRLDYRRVDPLYPLISHATSPEETAHRFWPLYRYRKTLGGSGSTDFTALAELIRVENGPAISAGPEILLRPFTYQSTAAGDHRFRFLWKLFESRRLGDDRAWGLHPLIYSRTNPDRHTVLFLGGLLGYQRQQGRRSFRALWVFDIPAGRVDEP